MTLRGKIADYINTEAMSHTADEQADAILALLRDSVPDLDALAAEQDAKMWKLLNEPCAYKRSVFRQGFKACLSALGIDQ